VAFWLAGASPETALRYANAAGANAVTKVGPMEGAATRNELDALLGHRKG
jgi:tagatose kinase